MGSPPFVTLIPTVYFPSHMGGFQRISLVWSLYKLLAKVLVGKLFGFMDNLISFNMSTFLNSKLLLYGVVAVNKLADLVMKSKKLCFIFKLDV